MRTVLSKTSSGDLNIFAFFAAHFQVFLYLHPLYSLNSAPFSRKKLRGVPPGVHNVVLK